ncbi:MAG TPA: hypothetical protein VMT62_03730 [Syntrophorhabdaceae bacterium]|nr:hypothetical protein [Syntrophorhabdaceae bacterium]
MIDEEQAARMEHKLDLILHALGLDGKKSSLDIKQHVKVIAIQLRERQLTKHAKKHITEACP